MCMLKVFGTKEVHKWGGKIHYERFVPMFKDI